jgi:hypothetical protein
VYAYNPIPGELTPEQAGSILGTQFQVWTEYLTGPRAHTAASTGCALLHGCDGHQKTTQELNVQPGFLGILYLGIPQPQTFLSSDPFHPGLAYATWIARW